MCKHLHCTANTVQFAVYTAHCTVDNVEYTVYNVHCKLYSTQSKVCSLHFKVYSVRCLLYSAQFTMYNVQSRAPGVWVWHLAGWALARPGSSHVSLGSSNKNIEIGASSNFTIKLAPAPIKLEPQLRP